jgi:hypothetical protein
VRGEDLAKQPAATNTSGVVGSKGSTIPITAVLKKSTPNKNQSFIF